MTGLFLIKSIYNVFLFGKNNFSNKYMLSQFVSRAECGSILERHDLLGLAIIHVSPRKIVHSNMRIKGRSS